MQQSQVCQVGNNYAWVPDDIIGQGRISTIFKGFLRNNQTETIALKKFGGDLIKNKNIYLRDILKHELQILKVYKPQNFIRHIDIEETQNSIYWISDLADFSLRQELILRQENKLQLDEVKNLCRDLLNGYLFLINLNILHQDIRPEGILKKKNTYYFSDLGAGHLISRFLEQQNITPYQSPQRISNQIFTGKCDVWSIGVILHECLFGITPKIVGNNVQVSDELNNKQELIYDFVNKCLKYTENERISWEQIYNHPFVRNDLQIIVEIERDGNYNQFREQFHAAMSKVDIYLMFGINSKDSNMDQLSKAEFINGAKKALGGGQNLNSINYLFYQIAGFTQKVMTAGDIRNWLTRDKNRLKGDRGFHYPLSEAEQLEFENQMKDIKPLKWIRILNKKQLVNTQLLSTEVIGVLKSLRASIIKFNTDLNEIFKKYDPHQQGGITKFYLDKIILKMYPEGKSDVVTSHVFQFLNQYQNGKISLEEFKFCIFEIDYDVFVK